jgi:hypothetical protein
MPLPGVRSWCTASVELPSVENKGAVVALAVLGSRAGLAVALVTRLGQPVPPGVDGVPVGNGEGDMQLARQLVRIVERTACSQVGDGDVDVVEHEGLPLDSARCVSHEAGNFLPWTRVRGQLPRSGVELACSLALGNLDRPDAAGEQQVATALRLQRQEERFHEPRHRRFLPAPHRLQPPPRPKEGGPETALLESAPGEAYGVWSP